jgi:hypothetical protein
MPDIIDYSSVKGWAVTAQNADQVIVTDAGQVITGTQVYFATEDGNNASVFAPDQHYTKHKVHKAIHHRAMLVDEIGRLTRDSLK